MFTNKMLLNATDKEITDFLLYVFLEANKKMLIFDLEEIENDVSERTICADLKEMLNGIIRRERLRNYWTDVEYNRGGKKIKAIHRDNEDKPIQCDLILHSRGKKERDNLFCLEMKKINNTEKIKEDKERLEEMTQGIFERERQDNDSKYYYVNGYILGVFYVYDKDNKNCKFTFYVQGRPTTEFKYTFEELTRDVDKIHDEILKIIQDSFYNLGQNFLY